MEVLSLPWKWVDTKAKCIRFGDSKSGAQLRPIGQSAVALLDTLPRRDGSPHVLPAERGDGHFIGLPRVLAAIERFRATLGNEFWTPSPLLVRLAGEGKGFYA